MEKKKKLKILVGTNCLTMMDSVIVANHNQFWFRLGRNYADIDFLTYTPRRTSIDRMRNEAAKAALLNECDYLCFIDDDILLLDPIHWLENLINADKDVVASLTFIRGYPFHAMFFKHIPEKKALRHFNDYEKFKDANGIVECAAVGFSCVLIKTSLLQRVTTPYFITGPQQTEDVFFCMKARMELGEANVSIAVDTKVTTGHLLDPEPLAEINRKELIKYNEQVYGLSQKKSPVSGDRGKNYYDKVQERFAPKRRVRRVKTS